MAMAEMNENELTRRHGAARAVVQGLVTLTLLLLALAYAGVSFPLPQALLDPNLYRALWIIILFLGLGAIFLRRTRFNALRLQAVADLRGTRGLLATLQKTTVLVAVIGGAISLLGFVLAVRSGFASDMLKAGVVALAVLFYAYPRREAWRRVVEATQRPGGLQDASPAKGTTA